MPTMSPRIGWAAVAVTCTLTGALPASLAAAQVASPRDILTEAGFGVRDKATALARIAAARAAADAALRRNPNDREARMMGAMATGYAARFNRDRAAALVARKELEAVASANPADPEALVALAGWHLDAIEGAGMLAGPVLGARRAFGLETLDKATRLSGSRRAAVPALGALMRIRLDPNDATNARRLAEVAAAAPAPTQLDVMLKRAATQLLVPLRAGDGRAAQALARTLLPFGRVPA